MSGEASDGLLKIRKVADYQFGKGIGERLFPGNVTIVLSRKTRKIRYIFLEGKLLATLKPLNGLFSLTIEGARRVIEGAQNKRLWVMIQDDLVGFAGEGKDVFAKHVINGDPEIRPGEEAIVVDRQNNIVAVGRATLSGREMRSFRRGVAVKVRQGYAEKIKREKQK